MWPREQSDSAPRHPATGQGPGHEDGGSHQPGCRDCRGLRLRAAGVRAVPLSSPHTSGGPGRRPPELQGRRSLLGPPVPAAQQGHRTPSLLPQPSGMAVGPLWRGARSSGQPWWLCVPELACRRVQPPWTSAWAPPAPRPGAPWASLSLVGGQLARAAAGGGDQLGPHSSKGQHVPPAHQDAGPRHRRAPHGSRVPASGKAKCTEGQRLGLRRLHPNLQPASPGCHCHHLIKEKPAAQTQAHLSRGLTSLPPGPGLGRGL